MVSFLPEEWRPVISYGGGWIMDISSLGRIRNRVSGRVLTPCLAGRDRHYLYIALWDGVPGSRRRTSPVHVLVAEAFLGLKAPGLGTQVNHKDGVRTNNAITNLEIISSGENGRHAAEHKLKAWGERHGMSRLTADQIREIRSSNESDRDVAPRYGVRRAYIWQIRHRKVWKHLDEDVAA